MHLEICEHEIECNANYGLKCSENKICECIKVNRNENYWDVLHGKCMPSSVYNQTCHNDSACQTLTQKTICNEKNLCSCKAGNKTLDNMMWYANLGRCKSPNNYQSFCLDDKWCLTIKEGTFCNMTSKSCECRKQYGDENYFSDYKCIKAKEIGQVGCMIDEWCQTLTQGTFCNPTTNICECFNGFYWTGGYVNGNYLNSSVSGEKCGKYLLFVCFKR
jgi:hypothetical protein